VADLDANTLVDGTAGTVFIVDPATGRARIYYGDDTFYWLGGIATGSRGLPFVTDHGDGTTNHPPAVLAFGRTVYPLSQGGYLQHPDGLAVDASGNIIVADSLAKALIMVDQGGNQTLLTTNAPFAFPTHVAIDPVSGDYFVTDGDPTPSTLANFSGVGALWRVNHTTFEITQISAGGFFEQPRGIVIQH
jgi:DNA-binding beta-propeller fold protein YncE